MVEPSPCAARQLAVLIDAENVRRDCVGPVLARVARLVAATVRRAYGDFTSDALRNWRDDLLLNAV